MAAGYGHQVDVWTPTSDGTYDDQPYEVREIIVYGKSANRALPLLEYNARKALRLLRSRLKEEGTAYDVVVPCTHPYYGAGRILGAPEVFFNFGNVPTAGFSWKGKLNRAWLDFSETYLHKPRCARVVSISNFLHELQRPEIQRRGCVVPLAGDHYASEPDSAEVGEFRQRMGIARGAVVLGYCGRLHKDHPSYKGTREVLSLGRRIASKYLGVHTVLCGIGVSLIGQIGSPVIRSKTYR